MFTFCWWKIFPYIREGFFETKKKHCLCASLKTAYFPLERFRSGTNKGVFLCGGGGGLEIVQLNRFSLSGREQARGSTEATSIDDCEELRRSYSTNRGAITTRFSLAFRKTKNFRCPTTFDLPNPSVNVPTTVRNCRKIKMWINFCFEGLGVKFRQTTTVFGNSEVHSEIVRKKFWITGS